MILLTNMTSLPKQKADGIIRKEQKGKDLKHKYATNTNILTLNESAMEKGQFCIGLNSNKLI